MKFERHYRPPEIISAFLSHLLSEGYSQRPLCDYEVLRVEKDGKFYMIYERENRQVQSWHPHLFSRLRELESASAI